MPDWFLFNEINELECRQESLLAQALLHLRSWYSKNSFDGAEVFSDMNVERGSSVMKKIIPLLLLSTLAAYFLTACGGGGHKPERLYVRGLLKVPSKSAPAKKTFSSPQKSVLKGLAKTKATQVRGLAKASATETIAAGTCDLLNSHFEPIASADVDSDGSFLFLVSDVNLVDATNQSSDGVLTYHVRCSAERADGGKAV